MRHFGIAFAAALVAGAALAAPGQAQSQQDFRWSGRIAQGSEVRVRNISGDIRAELGSGDQVEVVGHRTGRDADEIRVEVVPGRDGVTICAIFPNSGWRGRDNDDDDNRDRSRGHRDDGECSGRGNRSSHTGDFHGSIDFVVRLPAGVRLAAGTVSGDVFAEGLRSPVSAASVSGDVRVSTTGPAEANTVSGNVFARLGRMGSDDLSFNSVSGDVTVQLPAGADADISAQTLSGRIDSDWPLEYASRRRSSSWVNVHVGEHATGTIGRGGVNVSLHTVSGDIHVGRGR